jgi:hypothetical protein
MPKNKVTDLITDQEMAFAHLILSGAMTDRRAAEAVGLNPETAAYTKAKPRVRDYMLEHRAAVREKLVDQEADLSRRAVEGLRKLNIGRDQILTRLWELAALSHEATRGSIAGQIKALSMIAAIEGLIPDRRFSPSAAQPAPPPVEPDIYRAKWLREQRHQPAGEDPADPLSATETQPDAPDIAEPAPEPTPEPANDSPSSNPNPNRNQISVANPFINPVMMNRVPEATNFDFGAVLNKANSVRLSFSPDRRFSGKRR